jgi:uncharacterized SAM-binding protein YcdF (DUF218 family)
MFVLAKVLGTVTEPLNLMLLLMAAGCLLLFTRWARQGRKVVLITVVVSTVLSVVPLGRLAVNALENRFPPLTVLPDHVDGIIVLGGAISPVISAARGQVSLNGAAERVTALVPLARYYPQARLIYTGGSGTVLDQDFKEGAYVPQFYREIGFDADRVVIERQSRNTRENALYSRDLMQPKPGETWLLITSAFHMPRSVGAFRAVGWPVVAYPVDYETTPTLALASSLHFSVGEGVGGLGTFIHEALGLAAYRLRGWTDSLLPGP